MDNRKSKLTAILLAFFLGGIGIHRFYLGQTFSGLMYLLFSWTFIPAFLALVDFIVLILMSQKRFDERFNPQYYQMYGAGVPLQIPHQRVPMDYARDPSQGYDGAVGSSTAAHKPARDMEQVQFELQALKEMYEDELLTEDEYHEQRHRILNS